MSLQKDVVNRVSRGIQKRHLYHYLSSFASELNIPASYHALKSRKTPKERLFIGLIKEWASTNGKEVSILGLLSAIVKIRGMGVVLQDVASVTGHFRSSYAECLRTHVGKHWVQLALHLGFNRTKVDDIVLRSKNNLHMQLSEFLGVIAIPDLGNSTMALILVALHAADLLEVEKEVFQESQKKGFLDENGHVIDSSHATTESTAYADLRSSDPLYQEVARPNAGHSLFSRADVLEERSVSVSSDHLDSICAQHSDNLTAETTSAQLTDSPRTLQLKDDIEQQMTAIRALEEKQEEALVIGLFSSDPLQVFSKTKEEKSPLHLAAAIGYVNLVEHLLVSVGHTATEYVNCGDHDGMTPLMVACEHQQVKVAEMLLQAKADPNILDNIGRSCLHTVAAARNANLISLLCSHDANPHSCENDTRIPPLTVAALFGDLASVKALMEFGANPNYPKNSLLAPIIAAAQEGQINIVKFLLERGADPSAGNPYGYSALHFAALRKHYDVVKCILSEDPSPDILTEDKATPLMCAAAGGSEEIVKLLIDSGAQVDAVRTVKMASGKVQVSPVAEAALSSHFGVVRVLIENNAYLHHLSGGVHSVLEFACAGGDPEIVQLIVSKFDSDVDLSEYEVPIIRAVADGNFECAKAIVDKIGMQTLLDKATSTGKQQFADALCRYGDVLKDHQMVLPNVGRKMSRTVGTSEDIFLQFRYQQMSVQIQVDCIKYAVLFQPLSVVREERKLYVDVCWHLLHHFENKEELYTNALECGYVDVVAFLEDYSDKAVVTEAESSAFLRRIQSGDPTPVQFLCSATTVDSLWDTAESTNKDSVAQFFTEVQARSQKSGCSAFLNIKRVFNESMMTAILEKLKKSVQENYEEPILCCLSYGESHGPNEWSESVLDEIPDSASMLHCYELVQSNKTPDEPEASRRIPSCQDDLSQEHMRNNETLVTQPSSSAITSVTYSANSVTSFVSDNSSCEMTSSKGTNDGPIPPPNTTVYGKAFEQSQHPPLEKALNKLRELDKGMQLNQPIYSFENHRKVLTKVAAKVGTKWSFLARYFGMEEDTIKTFKTRSSNIGERSCQMLRFWIKENVETATWGVLCDNLVRILRGDIADLISQYLFGNRDHSILQYAGKNVGSNIDILMFVANQVGSYWERLATELGVTVRQTATCDEDLCITVLCEWINASHQPRLYCQLYDALENIELGDSIALIEEELQAS